ncbi:hypothetical protein CRUP_033330 [Coryphaenoides rupestris]|nr:hypothetical protein CRUP_033330 [Coryphaenoides rupestris]
MKEDRVSLGLQPGSGTDAALERPGTVDVMSDTLSQKADSDGGSSSTEDKRSRSELSSPTDLRPPETFNSHRRKRTEGLFRRPLGRSNDGHCHGNGGGNVLERSSPPVTGHFSPRELLLVGRGQGMTPPLDSPERRRRSAAMTVSRHDSLRRGVEDTPLRRSSSGQHSFTDTLRSSRALDPDTLAQDMEEKVSVVLGELRQLERQGCRPAPDVVLDTLEQVKNGPGSTSTSSTNTTSSAATTCSSESPSPHSTPSTPGTPGTPGTPSPLSPLSPVSPLPGPPPRPGNHSPDGMAAFKVAAAAPPRIVVPMRPPEDRVSLGLQPGSGTDAALERPGTAAGLATVLYWFWVEMMLARGLRAGEDSSDSSSTMLLLRGSFITFLAPSATADSILACSMSFCFFKAARRLLLVNILASLLGVSGLLGVLHHDVGVEFLQLLDRTGYLAQVLRALFDLELFADLTADLVLDLVQLLLDHGIRQVQVVSQAQPFRYQLAPGIPLGSEARRRRRWCWRRRWRRRCLKNAGGGMMGGRE